MKNQQLITEVREYIKKLNTTSKVEVPVEQSKTHNNDEIEDKPHKPSLDFQILERRQDQVLRKYKRPPGYSEAKIQNVIENELEDQSQNRFKHPWKQLPLGFKKNRIKFYLNFLRKKYKWSREDFNKAEILVNYKIPIITTHDLIYDEQKGRIRKIASLSYHHSPEGLHFKWKKIIKKQTKI